MPILTLTPAYYEGPLHLNAAYIISIRTRPARGSLVVTPDSEHQVLETPTQILALLGAKHEPAACVNHTCAYYTHYLAYGPDDLTHDGYHAADLKAGQHISTCRRSSTTGVCSICADWEQRLRV